MKANKKVKSVPVQAKANGALSRRKVPKSVPVQAKAKGALSRHKVPKYVGRHVRAVIL